MTSYEQVYYYIDFVINAMFTFFFADRLFVTREFSSIIGLEPGASYGMNATIRVPHAIYGNFSVSVRTDIRDRVYEHTAEMDNVRSRVCVNPYTL